MTGPTVHENGRDRSATPFEDGWRLADETIRRALEETEAGNEIPPSDSRTFRPVFLDRPVSYWPAIIVALLATALLAGWLLGSIYYVIQGRGNA